MEAKSLDDSMIMTEGNPEPWRETYTLDENQMHLFPVQTTPQDIWFSIIDTCVKMSLKEAFPCMVSCPQVGTEIKLSLFFFLFLM